MSKKNSQPLLDEELPSKKKKKPSLIQQIKDWVYPPVQFAQKRAPIAFNVALGFILFIIHFSAMIMIGTTGKYVLLIPIVITLYLLIAWIKAEREREPEEVKRKNVFKD